MAKVKIEDLIDALKGMCLQYLSRPDGSMTHDFMSAGESALGILCDLGMAKETCDGAVWVPAEQHPTIEQIKSQILDLLDRGASNPEKSWVFANLTPEQLTEYQRWAVHHGHATPQPSGRNPDGTWFIKTPTDLFCSYERIKL